MPQKQTAKPIKCRKIEAHRVYGELTKCWNCGLVLEPTGKGIGWKHVPNAEEAN